jgi:hypothetical protein
MDTLEERNNFLILLGIKSRFFGWLKVSSEHLQRKNLHDQIILSSKPLQLRIFGLPSFNRTFTHFHHKKNYTIEVVQNKMYYFAHVKLLFGHQTN